MNETAFSALPPVAVITRWGARILSALILLFWGFFILGHLFGNAGNPSRPLTINDYVILSAMFISLVGLGVAWKWEFVGAITTLAAVLVGAIVNWKVLVFPGTLIPFTACLFLLSWWTSRAQR